MKPRRGYSDAEVDEYVEQQQLQRHAERLASPDWELVEDEFSDLFGPTLVERTR